MLVSLEFNRLENQEEKTGHHSSAFVACDQNVAVSAVAECTRDLV